MSEIRATTISDLAGTGPATLTGQYAAKAWVNFNGTGTVAIRESGNVSSITDNATGGYSVNFTNAMADANYGTLAVSGSTGRENASMNTWSNQTTTQTRAWNTNQYSNFAADMALISVSIHGDLA